MTSHDRTTAAAALANTWAADLLTSDGRLSARDTLRPPETTVDETGLPRIDLGSPSADFEIEGRLGEGGMAVVERAWQRSLGRDVAVKRARDTLPGTRGAVVREARIAGALEHPNIIPVHALGNDESGGAVIVMKRVSGASWAELLADFEHPLWGDGDRLLRNLEILVQVCHAMELAHARGWLHRDLKTGNVMVGEFGEVYVLDWGIAIPLAVAEKGEATFAGTPAYMAPEMAACGVLSAQTDVFLLGTMLHEILTGQAINDASSLAQMVNLALAERTRSYPREVPSELGEIAARATAYHPQDRYPGVAALRRAIAEFVVHRGALEIVEHASARMDEVERRTVDDPRGELVEARAGFRQSLELWANNPRAIEGLGRCLRGLAEQELDDDNPAAAAGWAAQLDPRDAALDARIEAKRAELERRARELASLRNFAADRDLMSWARDRSRRAFVFMVVTLLLGACGGAAMRAGWLRLGYLELTVVFVVSGGAAVLAALANYRSQNMVSRSIAQVMVLAALTPFPMLVAAWRLGLPPESVLGLDALLKAAGSLVLGMVLQPVFRWVALINVATAAMLFTVPGTFPLEISAGGLATALLVVVIALRRGEPQVDLEPR